ncbi:MAG: hypothetical protein Kow0042_16930 [Calditrichia bacterium]
MIFSRILLALLILASISCVKYSFKGALPSYLKNIYISDFENQTQYPTVREEFMQKVTEAFVSDNSLKVVPDDELADLILEGSIVSIRKQPVSITAQEQVQEFHMVVTVKAECKNMHTNKPLWSGNLSRFGIISGTALSDEIDLAISTAIDQIVEDIITKTVAAW